MERQSNVEIYKKGLKKETYLHPALCLWLLRPLIEWTYKSNYNGDILKRGFKIKFLRKSTHGTGYTTYFSPCWGTWRYLYDKFKREIKQYNENGDIESLKSAIKPSFNRSWEYRWFEFFTRVFYGGYHKKLKVSL
jgi:hypothetical protein